MSLQFGCTSLAACLEVDSLSGGTAAGAAEVAGDPAWRDSAIRDPEIRGAKAEDTDPDQTTVA